jgi:plasmid stability protein
MRNVTITLDEETAAWLRIYAARQEMSVSRFVGEVLQERMRESREYEQAMRAFLARSPVALRRGSGTRYPPREELHDRGRLR